MVFNQKYDTALWYILKSDKKNRKQIIEFINEIPPILLQNLRCVIDKKAGVNFDRPKDKKNYFRFISKDNPHIMYSFLPPSNYLTIGKYEFDYDGDDLYIRKTLFELELYPLVPKNINEVGNLEEKVVGTITRKREGDGEPIESKYSIMNTKIGKFVGCERRAFWNSVNPGIGYIKPINIYNVPEDIKKSKVLSKNNRIKKH